jgi:hypothetical protein
MSSAGTALAPAPAPSAEQAIIEQKLRLQSRTRSGASWIMAVALFSVVNSVLVVFDAKLHFIVGLGITQVADVIGQKAGEGGSVAGFVVSLFMAGIFTLFWKFARSGQQWAFIVAMVIYALDGLIFLAAGAMLDFGFHLFALYCMYKGLSALNALNKLNAQNVGYAVSQTIAQ